ncbi:hypothetical protein tb265_49840 [Gemmatimonadetes bacterium T265]|nr:hypothetical protein tb265_49840 [Gemmatimonadetes bacterium T265]
MPRPARTDGPAAAPSAARPWEVLLLGGSSGVGKSTVARELAQRFGVAWSQVDGHRLLLARATTAETHPALHADCAADAPDALSAEALCARWIEVARCMSAALEVVIALHAATRASMVLEGDTLVPALAAQRVFDGVPVGRRVRAVYLWEPDETCLRARYLARGRGFQWLTAAQQSREVRRSWLYGCWLRDEAERRGVPVVPAGESAAATAARVVSRLGA